MSGSGRKVYVGSGGKKASFAAIRLGQGGQQKRQHTSLKESPFILHCTRRQEIILKWRFRVQEKHENINEQITEDLPAQQNSLA